MEGQPREHLVTHHQEDERERQSNQTWGSGSVVQMFPHSPCCIYKEGTSKQALPVIGQLGGGLRLSPQRLRGDKTIEIKGLFPREHVIHGPAQLVREYGQRFGFAMFVFQFRKILLAGLIVA